MPCQGENRRYVERDQRRLRPDEGDTEDEIKRAEGRSRDMDPDVI